MGLSKKTTQKSRNITLAYKYILFAMNTKRDPLGKNGGSFQNEVIYYQSYKYALSYIYYDWII